MEYIGGFISLQILLLAGYMLYKRYNASITLLCMGAILYLFAYILGLNGSTTDSTSGSKIIDFFILIKETFSSRLVSTGLLIMLIGGYVEYMRKIRANEALVYVAMQPLSFFKKIPYLAAIMVLLIGQLLFFAIPSAVGLGLLLITTVYPILVGLGVSKLTALSMISACTIFDLGPTSSNTLLASSIIDVNSIAYFISQLKAVLPTLALVVIAFYLSNRYFDKKEKAKEKQAKSIDLEDFRSNSPLYYAILPALPLILTLAFSRHINTTINFDTSCAIIISFFVAGTFELFRRKSVKTVFALMGSFWHGMGRIFTTVVVLIVAADIFSHGLINLGFIDSLLGIALAFGTGIFGVIIIITLIAFFASVLTGSGVASFSAFGKLVPGIASKIDVNMLDVMLPVQLAAGLGRAASPIAVVIIVLAEFAGVSPLEIAKRNFIPTLVITLFLLLLSFI